MISCVFNLVSNSHTYEDLSKCLEMSGETPPRGFPHHLPPTVPAPNQYPQHRRPPPPSWPQTGAGGAFFGSGTRGGGGGGMTWSSPPVSDPASVGCPPKVNNVIYGLQVFSGSPQSEGMDLSSTAPSRLLEKGVEDGEEGGGSINGQMKKGAVSVIASNPLREEALGRRELPPASVDSPTPTKKPVVDTEPSVPPRSPLENSLATEEAAPPTLKIDESPPRSEEQIPPLTHPTQPHNLSSPLKEEMSIKTNHHNCSPSRDSDSGEDSYCLKIVSPKDEALSPEEVKKVNGGDAVESLLENMFQSGGLENEVKAPLQNSVIVSSSSHLTEDKVVAILEDKVEVKEETHDSMSSNSLELMDISTTATQGPLPTPDKKKFLEVEFELEKMFAGIEEEDKLVKGDVELIRKTPPVIEKKRGRKPLGPRGKAKQTERKRKTKKETSGSVPMGLPKTKRASVGSGGQARGPNTLMDGNIGGMNRVRGPFVHIEGDKQNPQYVSVVNGGYKDEEEREKSFNDTLQRRKTPKLKFVEGRVKGPDLYSSTLSARYNSQSADETWICIFCKQRPHCEKGLGGEPAGDLFGPYILNLSRTGVVSESGIPSDQEVASEQKKRGGGKQLSLRAAGIADQFTASLTKKSKKSHTTHPSEAVGEKEVWVHEKCAVWAPGVLMVGSNLIGLSEAVSAALATKCSKCGEAGAGVGCVVGNCSNRSHYGCALVSSWSLDHFNFISRCPLHHLPSLTVK